MTTVYNKLTAELGREPTAKEIKAYVKAVLKVNNHKSINFGKHYSIKNR